MSDKTPNVSVEISRDGKTYTKLECQPPTTYIFTVDGIKGSLHQMTKDQFTAAFALGFIAAKGAGHSIECESDILPHGTPVADGSAILSIGQFMELMMCQNNTSKLRDDAYAYYLKGLK